MLPLLLDKEKRAKLPLPWLHLAEFWRNHWSFIKNETILRNISYQIQYLEFLINLWNKYVIYGSIQTSLCKNIVINTTHIIEAALSYSIEEVYKQKYTKEERILPTRLFEMIGIAHKELHIISEALWHELHELRKESNKKHIQKENKWELEMYDIKNTNIALELLEKVRKELSDHWSQYDLN